MFAYLPESGDESGFAVVTPRFACLLGPDATAEIARSIFWLLDSEDAQLQDALGTLSHIERVGSFAIVEIVDPSTLHVSARGAVTVSIDGSTTARASVVDDATVITTDARDVRSAWLSLTGSAPEGDSLPLYRGIARSRGLVTDAPVTTGIEAGEFAAEALPEVQPEHVEPTPEPESVVEPTPEPESAPEQSGPASRWVLQLPDGSEVEAEGTIVIGRDEWEQPREGDLIRHVSVPSPMKQISGDHLELALVGADLVARDLDSTNGTIVLTEEQPPRLLHRGETTALRAGDILDLGESLRIVVSTRG